MSHYRADTVSPSVLSLFRRFVSQFVWPYCRAFLDTWFSKKQSRFVQMALQRAFWYFKLTGDHGHGMSAANRPAEERPVLRNDFRGMTQVFIRHFTC